MEIRYLFILKECENYNIKRNNNNTERENIEKNHKIRGKSIPTGYKNTQKNEFFYIFYIYFEKCVDKWLVKEYNADNEMTNS